MSAVEGMQKQLYGIGLFEEEIVLSDFTGAGEKRFVISPEQLMAFIRTEVTFRPFPGLVWMKSGTTVNKYLLLLPAGTRTLLYRKGKRLTTPRLDLPALAVEACIDQNERRISSIRMWGLAEKKLCPESVLYELPLPNLSGPSLCLGSTERVVGDDVKTAVERTIFDTPFNNHRMIVGREQLLFHDYVKKYGGRCPLRTLKRLGTGRDIL